MNFCFPVGRHGQEVGIPASGGRGGLPRGEHWIRWFWRHHQEAKVSKRGKMHTGIEKTDEMHKSAWTFQLNMWSFSKLYVWNIAQAGELEMWTLSCLLFTFTDWFGETCLHKMAFSLWMSACWTFISITSCWRIIIHKTYIMLWFMQGALDNCIWTLSFIHSSFLSSGISNEEVLRCTVFSIHYVQCTLYYCKITEFPTLHACICM